jgi:hypothetical protein
MEEKDRKVDRVMPPAPEITFFLYSIALAMCAPVMPISTATPADAFIHVNLKYFGEAQSFEWVRSGV